MNVTTALQKAGPDANVEEVVADVVEQLPENPIKTRLTALASRALAGEFGKEAQSQIKERLDVANLTSAAFGQAMASQIKK